MSRVVKRSASQAKPVARAEVFPSRATSAKVAALRAARQDAGSHRDARRLYLKGSVIPVTAVAAARCDCLLLRS